MCPCEIRDNIYSVAFMYMNMYVAVISIRIHQTLSKKLKIPKSSIKFDRKFSLDIRDFFLLVFLVIL